MIVESLPSEVRSIVRNARRNGNSVGCIPTMGALHQGHVSLVERARAECDFVVATIFVNPIQFGPNEDFSKYPRTLEADLELCRNAGADLIFTPQTASMYSSQAQTIVRVAKLASVLEGAHRPGHFDGVSTVVAKLFNITEPDRAYFGQKDFQQQLIIRQMVMDLDQPEHDGSQKKPASAGFSGLFQPKSSPNASPARRRGAALGGMALTLTSPPLVDLRK